MARQAMPWVIRCKLARDIASGGAYIHAQNVIHRDLKPENIMVRLDVGAGPTAVIVDFGLARVVHGTTLLWAGRAVGAK
jgi:serine/threonine protein kinase